MIVKLAHKEEYFNPFLTEKLNVGLLEENRNVIQNFRPSSLINKNYHLSEKKLFLSGDTEVMPGLAEVPIVSMP